MSFTYRRARFAQSLLENADKVFVGSGKVNWEEELGGGGKKGKKKRKGKEEGNKKGKKEGGKKKEKRKEKRKKKKGKKGRGGGNKKKRKKEREKKILSGAMHLFKSISICVHIFITSVIIKSGNHR